MIIGSSHKPHDLLGRPGPGDLAMIRHASVEIPSLRSWVRFRREVRRVDPELIERAVCPDCPSVVLEADPRARGLL